VSRTTRTKAQLQKSADRATKWIGSTGSLIVHTALFIGAFLLPLFGLSFELVLLVLTTIVSLEAIYLAIFIQMTVNKNTKDIEIIQEDVEEIQEDVDEIQKDVDEIQEDVDEIQEDIEEIEEEHEKDYNEDRKLEEKEAQTLSAIQLTLAQLQKEIEQLKK
jgi:biopolymer transport protein ExbB/TolQ